MGNCVKVDASRMEVPVAVARSWPAGEMISDNATCNETHYKDNFILYGTWDEEGLSDLPVCVLDAGTGHLHSVRLKQPPIESAFMSAFRETDLVALALGPGIVLGCCSALRNFQAPPVVVWDLETGIMISEVVLEPSAIGLILNAERTAAIEACKCGGLRFGVGDAVECRAQGGWIRGRIVGLRYREDDWPEDEFVPYQIMCEDNGQLIFAPEDHPRLIRALDTIYSENVHVQLEVHQETHTLLIGLWHESEAQAKIY